MTTHAILAYLVGYEEEVRAWDAATSASIDPREPYSRMAMLRDAMRGAVLETDDGSDPEVAKRNVERLLRIRADAEKKNSQDATSSS